MKWLQGNPLGMALAGLSGLFALLALGMAVIWTLPVPVEVTDTEADSALTSEAMLSAGKVGELRDYLVITEKPVFNESRLPVIDDVEDELPEEEVDPGGIAIAGAPEVKLTGIIITPNMKIASLTPNDATQESVMAHEGESLIGEYVGWQVSSVNPRDVVLESRDGQKLSLELQIHDVTIKEPPKPKPVPGAQAAQAAQAENVKNDDDEPLSRAEQIRQRIAERREELRREQESQQGQSGNEAAKPVSQDGASTYQNAVRNKIRRSSRDKSSDDKEEG